MASTTEDTSTGRQSRRRAETRRKLLDAARRVMSEQGVEATSIQQITDAADVGFGSFYNHFESKDAIVEELMREFFITYEETLANAADHYEDVAQVVVTKCRLFMYSADALPMMAWFTVRVGMVRNQFREGLNYRLERDIERGVASGRFKVDDIATAVTVFRGAAMMMLWDRLEGVASPESAENLAEMLLRMLGLDAEEAHDISRMPLPDINLDHIPQ